MLKDHITGFQHLGLPVSDINRSKAFYAHFGFAEVMYKELPAEDDVVKVSMLELNGFILELYQLVGDELEEIKSRRHGHIDHLALDVVDIKVAYEDVQDLGFETLEDAPVFLPFWEKGIYYFNILGPDGERVEFCERIKSR